MPEWITKYWVEWVFGLLAAALAWMVKRLSTRIKKEQDENRALRDGMKALLKVNLEKECERCQRDGWCGAVKRGTISDMFGAYTGLGGNGGMKTLVEQTLALTAVEGGYHHD